MLIEIKRRNTGEVLWSGEAATLREGVVAAVKAGADLRGADLGGANLRGADLPTGFDRSAHKDPETPFVRRVPADEANRPRRGR